MAEPLKATREAPRDNGRHGELRANLGELLRTRSERLSELSGALGEGDELAIARVKALRRSLADVEAAQARLEQGGYGVCETCRRPIPPERLEIVPHARYCIACQRSRESRRS